jgi:hypothetical protein
LIWAFETFFKHKHRRYLFLPFIIQLLITFQSSAESLQSTNPSLNFDNIILTFVESFQSSKLLSNFTSTSSLPDIPPHLLIAFQSSAESLESSKPSTNPNITILPSSRSEFIFRSPFKSKMCWADWPLFN